MHEWVRELTLRSVGRFVAAHPWPTLLAGMLAAALCVAFTAAGLEFRGDRSSLVSGELEWNRRYAEYKEQFPRWSDVIVCIAGPPGDARIDAFARTAAAALRRQAGVEAAEAGFDPAESSPRLFRIAEEPRFEAMLAQLAVARRLAAAANASAALAEATAALQGAAGAPADAGPPADRLERLAEVLEPYLVAIEGRQPHFTWLDPHSLAAEPWQPFESPSGRIRFVLVQLEGDPGGVNRISAELDELRAALAALVAGSGLEEIIEWGVTGIPAIEADETTQSIRDSTAASVLAALLITVLMIVVFRGIAVPLLAAGSLLVGLAWSFGWLMITVGHLQLLSVVFTVILLGLGVDFAVHIVARLELVRDEHERLPDAMARVLTGIGPGIVTGAVTTAAAFFAVALTHFEGMAEMGVIAGGGILLCLVAACTIFPAALAATRRWKRIIHARTGGETAHFAWGRLDWVDPHPIAVLVVAGAIVAGLALAATRVQYDPNVLNLQSPNVESVRWEIRIMDDGAMSIWAGLVRTRPEQAPALVDALRALPQVGEIGGMGDLLPPDRSEREAAIAAVRAAPAAAVDAEPGMAPLIAQLAQIGAGLRARLGELEEPARAPAEALLERLGRAVQQATALDDEQRERRWRLLAEAFETSRDELAATLEVALSPGPLEAADLPPALRAQSVGLDGSWLLRVFPAEGREGVSLLDPQRLGSFVEAVRTVAPDVFGPPVQIHESTRLIIREYIKAAVYALAAILVILLIDFRRLADALCALLPVTIGFVGAFGIMGLVGAPLNFANIIVLPIIFGIGVDVGVHAVHRWRDDPGGRPAGLSGGTGRGITVTMLTTMIGFGCMLIADHRGIRSLGLVMLAGLGMTLLAAYTALPAVLQCRGMRFVQSDETHSAT